MVERIPGKPEMTRPAAARPIGAAQRHAAAGLREAVAAENRAAVVPQGLLDRPEEGQPGSLYDRSL